MSHAFCAELEARLVRYVQVETTSDEASSTAPSTAAQVDLQRMLEHELHQIGAQDVLLAENGFLYATLPATTTKTVPRVALLAHVDTVAGVGEGPVKPRVHRRYDGAPIVFPDDELLVLMPEINPYLGKKLGHDIITASGGTLLGADDKAGVAILMTLARHLLAHPELAHGELRLCFTPDEEIGVGIRHIDLSRLAADFAYTLDGGEVGEIVYETFSADKATVSITGVSTHPGRAKAKLVNALQLAGRIMTALPHTHLTPETTDARQGFLHLYKLEGAAAACTMHFILRDFEEEKLAEYARLLESVCADVRTSEPRARIVCRITPQYRNMRDRLQQDMRPVTYAVDVLKAMGIAPLSPPIRGGVDGSQLTAMGVPTPNLFTGMQNIHSPLEWISVQDMETAVKALIALVQRWAQ
ncbi:MAG: peptidase T [Caldilineaceae bacterium]|nr:peptidase T [Caldilineaceae bacterium]